MGKEFKAHPTLIPDAPEPARLQFGACGASEIDAEGEASRLLFGTAPFAEALLSIKIPPWRIPWRGEESKFDYFFLTWLDIYAVLNQKFGPPSGITTREEMDFLYNLIRESWLQHKAARG